jgi:hypothetical protein
MDGRKWIADGIGCHRPDVGRTDVVSTAPGAFRHCAGTISCRDRSVSVTDPRRRRGVVLSESVGSEVIVDARISESLVKVGLVPHDRPQSEAPGNVRALSHRLRLFDAGTGEAAA